MSKTHGMKHTKIYGVWKSMLGRCRRKKDPNYHSYGGRGIIVCERWKKFENFYADMGERSKGLTLERINNDGNYEFSNCKWATRKEQSNNSRRNIIIEYKGLNLTMMQWSERLGIGYCALKNRLRRLNWPIEKALTQPIRIRKLST